MEEYEQPEQNYEKSQVDIIGFDQWLKILEEQFFTDDEAISIDQFAKNYQGLLRYDPHLAEIYYYALTNNFEQISPVQAKKVVDEKSGTTEVYVDVLVYADSAETRQQLLGDRREYTSNPILSLEVKARDLPQLIDKGANKISAARALWSLSDPVNSLEAIESTKELWGGTWPELGFELDGTDVVIGIIDVGGCDFRHEHFRNGTKTRIESIWVQSPKESDPNSNHDPNFYNPPEISKPLNYGWKITQDKINEALNDASVNINTFSPYNALRYKPVTESHGTHVMGIAAGNHSIASNATIIFVHLNLPDPLEEEKAFMGNTKRLNDAVDYIFRQAGSRPVVVNLSIGGYGGPHDGQSAVEKYFDFVLDNEPNRMIVIAAGNSFKSSLHTNHKLPNGLHTIEWNILQHNTSSSQNQRQEIEIWYPKDDRYTLLIKPPDQTGWFDLRSRPGIYRLVAREDNTIDLGLLCHESGSDLQDDENRINIFLDNRLEDLFPIGTWKIRLWHQSGGTSPTEFHAWIERHDSDQTSLESPTTSHTLNSIANGRLPIVVGAVKILDSAGNFNTADRSSAGPTRNGAIRKPDVCAPGVEIMAAAAAINHLNGTLPKSGTSMAAPHVTGLIAVLLQVAQRKSLTLTAEDIRQLLIDSVSAGQNYDDRQGHGLINGKKLLEQLLP